MRFGIFICIVAMLVSVGICNAENNSTISPQTFLCQVNEGTDLAMMPCYALNLSENITINETGYSNQTVIITSVPTPVPPPPNVVLISSEDLWETEHVSVIAFNDTKTVCVMAHAEVNKFPSISCVPMSKHENFNTSLLTPNVNINGTYDDETDSITILTFADDLNRTCAITHADTYLIPDISCYEK